MGVVLLLQTYFAFEELVALCKIIPIRSSKRFLNATVCMLSY